ncbi:hypothetical protein STSR3_67 [Salmonella virus STSR3]|nr:hypothetical protein STSR3_67 [Salmonella virus STSR3]
MFKMIAFIGGFVVCGIIAFVLYLVICKGITECIKDNEMTFAVYNNKEDARKSRETLITLKSLRHVESLVSPVQSNTSTDTLTRYGGFLLSAICYNPPHGNRRD